MGCCFSKELNPNPVSERTSLLQTLVTESCSVPDVKQYSLVPELDEEKCAAFGQTNRAVDVKSNSLSTNLSARVRSIEKRSSSVQDGMLAWDNFKDDSCNKRLGDISKDSDSEAQTETAVLNSVKRTIAENAVKRANWFCEVHLSQPPDSERFKPQCENPASDTRVTPDHHIRATCTSDNVSSVVLTTQTQEHGHTISSISLNNDPNTNLFTAKYLCDDLLDSVGKTSDFLTSECSMKRRTQSFYSICSIDADDLGCEHEPAAMTDPAAFDPTDLLTSTETRGFNSTSLHNTALETSNRVRERQEVGEKVSEDLPAEKQHVLHNAIGMFCDVGLDEHVASLKCVSVPSEDSMTKKSETYRDKSHVTGLDETVAQTILVEKSDCLTESVVVYKNVDSCETRVNPGAEFIKVTELGHEGQCSETPGQESKRVFSESRNVDNNNGDHFSSCLDCNEPKQVEPNAEVSHSVMSGTWHKLLPRCVKPYNDLVQDFLSFEISSVSQIIKNDPSSFVPFSLEGDQKSQSFSTESSSKDADTLNLFSKSCASPVQDRKEPGEFICSYPESEDMAVAPVPRSKFNSLQKLNSFTSDISGGNVHHPKTFRTGFVDYSGFDARPLLAHHDAEKREINLGMEDVAGHITSTELSDVAPEIAVEHVETSENLVHVNSNTDYDFPPEASQSLVKDFCENLVNVTQTGEKFSPLPFVSSVKEEDECFLQQNETPIKSECFNEQTSEGPNPISFSFVTVKTPEMELQNSKSTNFNLTLNDEQEIHLFLEGSSENTALFVHSSCHAGLHDPIESTTLSKNSLQCGNAHVPTHTLLGKTEMQSSSHPLSQELVPTLGDVQDMHVIRTAVQQVEIDYKEQTALPLFDFGEPAHALKGPDGFDEGVGGFVTSSLQGYKLEGLHVSATGCDLGADGVCPVLNISPENKAIPLPVEPDQVDLYASMPSYEIHFLGPNALAVPVQNENPQNLTSTNESERERGVLNMVSDLLGKSEVNGDCIEDGDCSQFLSVWAGEPELASASQYRLSEDELMGRDGQDEGKADSALDSECVQAFTEAYPYSLLVSDVACVWDWQNAYGHLVSLH